MVNRTHKLDSRPACFPVNGPDPIRPTRTSPVIHRAPQQAPWRALALASVVAIALAVMAPGVSEALDGSSDPGCHPRSDDANCQLSQASVPTGHAGSTPKPHPEPSPTSGTTSDNSPNYPARPPSSRSDKRPSKPAGTSAPPTADKAPRPATSASAPPSSTPLPSTASTQPSTTAPPSSSGTAHHHRHRRRPRAAVVEFRAVTFGERAIAHPDLVRDRGADAAASSRR